MCETVPREMTGLGLCPSAPAGPCHRHGATGTAPSGRVWYPSGWEGAGGPFLTKEGWHRGGLAPNPSLWGHHQGLVLRKSRSASSSQRSQYSGCRPAQEEYFPPDAAEFLWCDSPC